MQRYYFPHYIAATILAVSCFLSASTSALAVQETSEASALAEDDKLEKKKDKVDKKVELKYGWKKGLKYGYRFTFETKIDEQELKAGGFAAFELTEENTFKDLQGKPLLKAEEGEATSTAFAVSADGYLLTCEHCVEGSTVIDIELNGKNYKGKVIDSDEHLDLAIVKIEAKDLTVVPLGDSNSVELAQDVRAVGFPLSDVLGSSVKVSRGIVSGVIERDGKKSFQVDAAVNFGNSGGPMVDQRGHVVGVTNAKLFGKNVQQIGFAVPIQYAREMLDRHKIKYLVAEGGEKLDGPDLARRVVPAVGFMKTTLGPDGYKAHKNQLLKVTGYLDRFEKGVGEDLRRRLPPHLRGAVGGEDVFKPRRETDNSRLILTSYGKLLDIDSQVELPFLMDPIALLPIESLPRSGLRKWETSKTIGIYTPKKKPRAHIGPRVPFGPRLRPRFGFDDFFEEEPEEEKLDWTTARESYQYEIKSVIENIVGIERVYNLKTIGESELEMEISLKGQFVFDLRQGVFVKSDSTGTLTTKIDGANKELPIKLSYEQVELGAFAGGKTAPDDVGFAQSKKDAGLSENQVNSFLKMSPDEMKRSVLINIVERLAKTEPRAPQSENVVARLKELLAESNSDLQKPAIDSLLRWDKSAAAPYVIEAFEKANRFSKRTWIARLGKTGDARAANLLVEMLTTSNRRTSQLALSNMGEIAEIPTLEFLQANIEDESAENCLEILKKIGTEKTVQALTQLLEKHPDWKQAKLAEAAVAAVKNNTSKE